ncbi:MAG TPA: hypothetical protein DD429_07385 [Clostridiaceae bacterium]|nr:hypothetical protein [Clostridiaceae bacterium]
MNKNIKLLYCIFGSVFLMLLTNPIFESSRLALFNDEGGYGRSIFGRIFVNITNVLSFLGFILFAVFSIALIITNIDFKNK